MAWCPKCKNEYRKGITHCPDCNMDLVEELELLPEQTIEIPEDYEFPEDFDPGVVLEGPREKPAHIKPYKSPEERYADMRSSAWTFLFVGGAGFIIIILALIGVYSLPFHDFALVVMLLLFAAFLVIGIVSFKNAGKLKDIAASEHALIEEITAWYHSEGMQSEAVTSLDASLSEELFYLQKYDAVCRILQEHFPDIREDLLNKLASDFCEE
ncbi:hypothetical protein [Candidatus Merdisoma sp. JLR.KK006]|uniref:hypothetical protein n=1 Tax=Candidatus Merdisoma sp. JLR.KK006 TaxID=3112626 RepID=UPI002FF0D3B1